MLQEWAYMMLNLHDSEYAAYEEEGAMRAATTRIRGRWGVLPDNEDEEVGERWAPRWTPGLVGV